MKNYIVVFLIVGCLVEIAVRGMQIIHRHSSRQGGELCFIFSQKYGWVRRPEYSGYFAGVPVHFDADGYFVDDGKQLEKTERQRVILFGDSATFGWEVEHRETFGELIDQRSSDFDVINMATPGYSSFHGLLQLKETTVVRPGDIVIIAFHHNDRRYVLSPEHQDLEGRFRDSFFTDYMVFLFRQLIESFDRSTIVEKTIGCDGLSRLLPRVDPERYAKNIAAMVELVRSRKAEVILLGLSDNPVESSAITEAMRAIEDGNDPSAILKQVLRFDLYSQIAFSLLCRWRKIQKNRGEGENVEIPRHLLYETLDGGKYLFTDRIYLEQMARVAREKKVIFVDTTDVFSHNPDCFLDTNHFDQRGHILVADLIEPVIVDSFKASFDEQDR